MVEVGLKNYIILSPHTNECYLPIRQIHRIPSRNLGFKNLVVHRGSGGARIYQPMAISPYIFLTNWIDLITSTLFFVSDDSSTSEQL